MVTLITKDNENNNRETVYLFGLIKGYKPVLNGDYFPTPKQIEDNHLSYVGINIATVTGVYLADVPIPLAEQLLDQTSDNTKFLPIDTLIMAKEAYNPKATTKSKYEVKKLSRTASISELHQLAKSQTEHKTINKLEKQLKDAKSKLQQASSIQENTIDKNNQEVIKKLKHKITHLNKSRIGLKGNNNRLLRIIKSSLEKLQANVNKIQDQYINLYSNYKKMRNNLTKKLIINQKFHQQFKQQLYLRKQAKVINESLAVAQRGNTNYFNTINKQNKHLLDQVNKAFQKSKEK